MDMDQQVSEKISLVFKPLFQLGEVVNILTALHHSSALTQCLIKHQCNEGENSSFEAANKMALFLGRGLVCNVYAIGSYRVLVKSILHDKITYVVPLA